ncbi:MAG: DUF4254 domain-containing protein [Candidatus Omnitrophica bacterium]|nr:DUF4254 domain-containing protein [Candidatus Omnitrophota bacterium]
MRKVPINPKQWFDSLSDSIYNLYIDSFKMGEAYLFKNTLNQLLVSNFKLWRLEDDARRKDVPDAEIAGIKRKIDKENQNRNDIIDNIDALLREDLINTLGTIKKELPLNSETPGSVFDRIIILAMRSHSLKNEISRKDASDAHIERCKKMLEEVEERSRDLVKCLEDLLNDYYSGRKRLKSYKQHKLYNDPELNPSLRKNS